MANDIMKRPNIEISLEKPNIELLMLKGEKGDKGADGDISEVIGNSPIIASATEGTVTLSHQNSGVTENTYGTDSSEALTPAFGETFDVPGFEVNATGHITSASSHTVKLPETEATESIDGLMSAADKTKLNGIDDNANHYIHPAHTAQTGEPTEDATPSFGDTVTVSQIISDDLGHVTAATDRTIKIPETEATTSGAGLMSASDKTKLNGLNVYVPFLSATNRTLIAEGTDLNTLTTAGTYYATDAVAATCTNCPVTTAFVLYVVNITSATYQQQILFKRSSVLRYTRYKASSTFGVWRSDTTATTETNGWMSAADKQNLDTLSSALLTASNAVGLKRMLRNL